MKKMCLVFHHFEQEHLGKDVFLAPYYLAKQNNYELEIVYRKTATNASFPKTYRNAVLKPIKTHFSHYYLWYIEWVVLSSLYIYKHAKEIELLVLFHIFFRSLLQTHIYKKKNKNGKIYVKLDIPDFIIRKVQDREHHKLWKWLYNRFTSEISICSVETFNCYNMLKNSFCFKNHHDKVVFMPNGFDAEMSKMLGLHPTPLHCKENTIITVGRIGTKQKNNELLLNAIEKIDIQEWKVYFIGNIEKDFERYIESFYRRNPSLRDKVIFTGVISDKKRLWEFYQKAKIFVLTSVWESYGLVLNEAVYFQDYVISTDVGAARDILGEKFGSIIQNSSDQLADILKNIIINKKNIFVYDNLNYEEITWESLVKRLVL